ncbi:MAG: adenylate/guanylate cyclase domain-containing protein [Anaerolineae bacterium]
MYCTHCGSHNPDNAVTCRVCRVTLSTDTHALQQALAVAQESLQRLKRFVPSVVAESILYNQERLSGERRKIAVLFADAVNFTHLSASLDAESVFNLINDLLGRLVACVHRYGGLVDKFTGDGLMAVFGAPVAHENNAEMAVRAALDMQRAADEFTPVAKAQLGAPLEIRIGIHSGPAIAGILGTAEQAAYTVIGDTVNMAARLEALAKPGNILVSGQVYTQTQAFFKFETMEATSIKGVDHPVVTYQVTGRRVAPEAVRGIQGVSSIFLGHEAELAQLQARLADFVDHHAGQRIVVQGEAGMGKSRLVSEWLKDVSPETARIWHGRGLPYTQGVSYGIMRSLLQNAIHTYPADEAWESHISAALLPFLKQIAGLPLTPREEMPLSTLTPESIKQLTELALREWFIEEARRHPLIVVLDDFHWADDLSRDLLKTLSPITAEVPLIFCVITRAYAEPPFAPFPVTERDLMVNVNPLTQAQSRELLAHAVDLQGLPESVIDTILTRAEGNPFYIEEFVRMLIEKGLLRLEGAQWHVISTVALEKLEAPTSLRGLMMARVDRLPENLRNVLRDASVIGLQFDARILESVERHFHGAESVAPFLERLTEAGLLEPRPQANAHTYAFRHILTQETIYDSILHVQRPVLHRLVAEALTELYADDLHNQAEVLAIHYEQARMRDKALEYTLLAGERARLQFANRKATEYYSRALQLSQHLTHCEKERWQAAKGLGDVQQHIGEYEEAIAFYQAALEEWKEAPLEAQAEVMLKLGRVWIQRGDMEEAETWLQRGLSNLANSQHAQPQVEAEIHAYLGWISLRRGDLAGARLWLEQGLERVNDTQHYDVLSSILNRLGAVYYEQGDLDRATQVVERALTIRESLGDILGVARSSNNLGILKCHNGEWHSALEHYQRGLQILEKIGNTEGMAIAHTNIGSIYIDIGDWDKAAANLQQGLTLAQKIANPYEMAQAHLNFGRLYLAQHLWDKAQQHLDTAIALYKQAGSRASSNLIDAYSLQGQLWLERGNVENAAVWSAQTYGVLQEVTGRAAGETAEWGRYEQLQGRIAAAQGNATQALEHLRRAKAIFTASRTHLEVGRTAYYCAQAWQRLNDADAARAELTAAQHIFEQLGAAPDLDRATHLLSELY